ncbi:MAG: AmmeMemoRadiSam system protein A [Candidatus Moranbacteria bacterium]|nr:AmmeMemoRadiSam system protein A [Candidatus Moranbacteria bacterium]
MNNYVKLAWQAMEKYIKSGEKLDASSMNLPREFYNKKGGVFVTIRKGGQLRGCIGTIVSTKETLAQEIIDNAVSACARDPRFDSVTESELPEIECEVSLLSEPRPVENLENHEPEKHGIIVKAEDGRSGLLLPDLEGVDSTQKQVALAAQKGGIDPYSEKIQLFEFEVEKHN